MRALKQAIKNQLNACMHAGFRNLHRPIMETDVLSSSMELISSKHPKKVLLLLSFVISFCMHEMIPLDTHIGAENCVNGVRIKKADAYS
jgi:hypothetical protein